MRLLHHNVGHFVRDLSIYSPHDALKLCAGTELIEPGPSSSIITRLEALRYHSIKIYQAM